MPLGKGIAQENRSQSFTGWVGNTVQNGFSQVKNTIVSSVNGWLDKVELHIHANADAFVKNSYDKKTGKATYSKTSSYVSANFGLETKALFNKNDLTSTELFNHFKKWEKEVIAGYIPVALFLKAFAYPEKNTQYKDAALKLKSSLKAVLAKKSETVIEAYIQRDYQFWRSAYDQNHMTLDQIAQAFEFYKDLFPSNVAFAQTKQNLLNKLQPQTNQSETNQTEVLPATEMQESAKPITLYESVTAIPKAIGRYCIEHPGQATATVGLIASALFLPGAAAAQQRRASFAPSDAWGLYPFGGPTLVNASTLFTYPDIAAVASIPPSFKVVFDTRINNGGPVSYLTPANEKAVTSETILLSGGLAPSVLSVNQNITLTATTTITSNEVIPTITTTRNNGMVTRNLITSLAGPAFLPPEVSAPYIIALAHNKNTNQISVATNRGPQIAVATANVNPNTGAITGISSEPTFPFNLPGTVQSAPNMVINPITGKPIIAAYYTTGTKGNYQYYVVANFNGNVMHLTDEAKTTGNDYIPVLVLNSDNTITATWQHGVDGIYQKKFSLEGAALGPQTLIAGNKYANATSAAFSGDCSDYSITALDDAIKSTAIVINQKNGQIITTADIGSGTNPSVDASGCIAGVTLKDSSGKAQVSTFSLGALTPTAPPTNSPITVAPAAAPITPAAPIQPPAYAPVLPPESSNGTAPVPAQAAGNNQLLGWLLAAGLFTLAALALLGMVLQRRKGQAGEETPLLTPINGDDDEGHLVELEPSDNEKVPKGESGNNPPKRIPADPKTILEQGIAAIFDELKITDRDQKITALNTFNFSQNKPEKVLENFKAHVIALQQANFNTEKSNRPAAANSVGYGSFHAPAPTSINEQPGASASSRSSSSQGGVDSYHKAMVLFADDEKLQNLVELFEAQLGEPINENKNINIQNQIKSAMEIINNAFLDGVSEKQLKDIIDKCNDQSPPHQHIRFWKTDFSRHSNPLDPTPWETRLQNIIEEVKASAEKRTTLTI